MYKSIDKHRAALLAERDALAAEVERLRETLATLATLKAENARLWRKMKAALEKEKALVLFRQE